MEKSPLLFGIILQASMIMALGAQNIFVLEKGLLKDRAFLVAAICILCDVSLIFLGVMGAGSFFARNASLTLLLKFIGAGFLFKYAFQKFREAGLVQEFKSDASRKEKGLGAIVLSTLAVTLLNPHVYLDTVVLLGGYATRFSSVSEKLQFALGAGSVSLLWFVALSLGAGMFSATLTEPKAMRRLNYASSLIMTYLGGSLLLSV